MYILSLESCLSTFILYVVLPPLLIFKSDISIVCLNVVPILGTPIVDVVLPLPVIDAHLSVPSAPHPVPLGIEAGPSPPQSESISPSLVEATNPLSPSRISPESVLVTVTVVVSTTVTVVVKVPCPSF